jgi:predicted RNase H-like nuclease (RuvC/YqgF family)
MIGFYCLYADIEEKTDANESQVDEEEMDYADRITHLNKKEAELREEERNLKEEIANVKRQIDEWKSRTGQFKNLETLGERHLDCLNEIRSLQKSHQLMEREMWRIQKVFQPILQPSCLLFIRNIRPVTTLVFRNWSSL